MNDGHLVALVDVGQLPTGRHQDQRRPGNVMAELLVPPILSREPGGASERQLHVGNDVSFEGLEVVPREGARHPREEALSGSLTFRAELRSHASRIGSDPSLLDRARGRP